MRAHGGGNSTAGLAISQRGDYLVGRRTTDATATELSTTGGSPGSTSRIILPNNSTYAFRGMASARSTGGDAKTWQFSGTIERGAAAANTAIIGSVTQSDNGESGASAWTLTISADTSNGHLKFEVVGAAATSISWLASVETVEVVR